MGRTVETVAVGALMLIVSEERTAVEVVGTATTLVVTPEKDVVGEGGRLVVVTTDAHPATVSSTPNPRRTSLRSIPAPFGCFTIGHSLPYAPLKEAYNAS